MIARLFLDGVPDERMAHDRDLCIDMIGTSYDMSYREKVLLRMAYELGHDNAIIRTDHSTKMISIAIDDYLDHTSPS